MGGKHKQANRTKNNARPSSSSHSAELLGNTIPTFFGFTAIKDGVSVIPGFSIEEANYSIHSDFQIQFKQMNKKDPTTRFKALQTFTDLCKTLDADAVKAILPLWPRMYCSLSTDIDHKVREAAHHAHRAVVSKVKKMIAPYLKELAGPWFTSQYDTYAPAASAATLAFEEAFPSTKLNKAIMFCQEEILSYIYDNLIIQTPQSLVNTNTTPLEDIQAKYERIIIASLQGYTLYLQKLSPDQIQEAEESNKKLISNQKFWKYSKNKVPIIRNCFFRVLIALCQRAKFLLNGEASRLSSVIFNNLDEPDSVVLHAVWDAALNVLVTIEDCWSHINVEKQVIGKLCMILKNGGRNVTTIYPNILPLLSKFPEDIIKDKVEFFGNLFDNMRQGLEVTSYSQTPSEIKIVANTFIECLKYVLMRNCTDVEFSTYLISNQLNLALEQKLSIKLKKSVSVPFLTQTVFLIHYLYQNRSYENPAYEKIIETFFENLFTCYVKQVNEEISRHGLKDILNNQVDFVSIMLYPNDYLVHKKGRVKFEDDLESKENEIIEPRKVFNFFEGILPFVKKLVVFYFKKTIDSEENVYIAALSRIISLFDPKIIYEEMTMAVNESTCFKLFSSYFSKWLMSDDMKCGELVDLSFGLLKYVTHDEKEYILEEFYNNWFSDNLHFSICKALPNYSEDDSIKKWIRSKKFAKNILSLTERFVNSNLDDKSPCEIIITLLKTKCANGEFMVNSSTADEVTNLVTKSLGKSNKNSNIIELAEDLIVNAKQVSQKSLEVLVASLFKLWCFTPENENLAKACRTGLKTVLLGFQSRGEEEFGFTKKLFEVIIEIILDDTIDFYWEQIIANINTYIQLTVNTNLLDSYLTDLEIKNLIGNIKIFLTKDSQWTEGLKMMEKCCRVGFESVGDLDFEYLKLGGYLESKKQEKIFEHQLGFDLGLVKRYLKWNLYVGGLLNLIAAAYFGNSSVSEETNNVDKEKYVNRSNTGGIEIVTTKIKNDQELNEIEHKKENRIQPLIEDIYNFLVAVGFFESFNKYYATTKYYQELNPLKKKLKSFACDLLGSFNPAEFNYIYDHCGESIREQIIWWLVQTTFKDIFNRDFSEWEKETLDKVNLLEKCFEDLKSVDIATLPMHRENYLKILVLIEKGYGSRFAEEQWERIFIFVHNFFDMFLNEKGFSEENLLTLSALSRLYLKLKKIFEENHTKTNEERILPETCLAWNEIVQMDVYKKFLDVWRKLAKYCYNEENIPPDWIVILQNVGDVILGGLSIKCGDSKESVDLGMECGKLMTSPHAVIQITSFKLCISTIPNFVKLDTEIFGNHVTQMFHDSKESSSLFKKNSNSNWTAKKLVEEFVRNQGIVEILLSDFFVGDCCTVEPFTDSFIYTYSYLLLWCFLLHMCGEAHSPLRFQYGCWLQDAGYSTTLLESIFKLMPQSVLHANEAKENCCKYFETCEPLDFRKPVKSESIEHMACFVYRLFLQRLPNVVREWWNQTENKTSTLVDKVTKLYVSPILISNELKNVQQDRETGFDNMEVKTYPGSREVVATYTIDEVKMDLVMTLPQNYPLGTIKIESSNVVVSTSNWRNWLFHICKYLIHQNGTIWDALIIWKNNLDKKFEGVEECYICFSILQGSTFETPRLSCHTCKKKFHSNCLYKWFSTSNKSTCPICRNLF